MASIKKNYSFSNKRNIWRLVPSASGYLVIEEREMNSKEVFFNCLKTSDGKILFKDFQLEEKYWIGIEVVYKDFIFFHKFRKPDIPDHRGIYAFDIRTQNLIWQNDDLIFLLAKDDKVYAYHVTFEGREYFTLDNLSGDIIEELGNNISEINRVREESIKNDFANNFLFPEKFVENEKTQSIGKIISKVSDGIKIIGDINWLRYNDYVMFNYHESNSDGSFNNCFKVMDVIKNKIVLNETLNNKSKNLISESFFIANDLLFLLVEKTKLVVYRIIQ
jgi:hypothetical protein